MMTDYQRQLFGQILDVNYEIEVGDYGPVVMEALKYRLDSLQMMMEEDMGVKEWAEWKEGGRKMFAGRVHNYDNVFN